MKKSALILLIFLALAATFGVVFWQWENTKKAEIERQRIEQQRQEEETKKQEESLVTQKENIDTSDWKTFKNDEYGFEMRYPKNFIYISQNAFNQSSGAMFLFYDGKFTDVAKDSNPLLAIIDKNVGYMDFTILTRKDFINKSESESVLKSFATPGLSGPGGEVYAIQKIVDWKSVKISDEKTVVYFYTTEAIELKTSNVIGKTKGAVWISKGNLFSLRPKGDEQQVENLVGLYVDMTKSFFQK